MNKQNSASRTVLLAGIVVFMAQLAVAQGERMPKETTKIQFLNPAGLSKPMGYTQVVVAQTGKLVYVSGQLPLNASGEVVGKGDLRAQVTQVIDNLKTALAAAGATMKDVVKVNYYQDLPQFFTSATDKRSRVSDLSFLKSGRGRNPW